MDRRELTQRILREFEHDIALDSALNQWWWDPRPQGGLRLTDSGWQIFACTIDLQHWQFDIGEGLITPKNLLALDRFMTCPYYLKRQRRQYQLTLFGDRESMMASIYGDVQRFIDSLAY